MDKLLGLVLLFSLVLPINAEAYNDKTNIRIRALLQTLKKKPALKIKESVPSPLLRFSLNPSEPTQSQQVSLFIHPDTGFRDRDISIEGKVDGKSYEIQRPSTNLFLLSLGFVNQSKSFSSSFNVFIENKQENIDIRDAIVLLDRDINRLTNQLNRERDPVKRKNLRAQRDEKIALRFELIDQLKRFRVKVGTQSYSFKVKPSDINPTLPRIVNISPKVGPLLGGTKVTVSGQNFYEGLTAKIDGISVPVTFINNTTIQFTTPAFSNEGGKNLEIEYQESGGAKSNFLMKAAFMATNSLVNKNVAPVAVTTGFRQFPLGGPIVLDGTQSYDENEDLLSFEWKVVSRPENSNTSIIYPPRTPLSSFNPDVTGVYVFELKVKELETDQQLESRISLLTAKVFIPANAAPEPTAPSISIQPGQTGTSEISPNDPDGFQSHTFEIATPAENGVATVSAGGILSYTPNSGFTGSDSVTVRVTDNGTPALFGLVSVSISVIAVNQPPQPTAPAISTTTGVAATSQVSPNDPDSGQTFTYSIQTPPANGSASVSASGLVTYQPGPTFVGNDSVTILVYDNGSPSLSGSVSIPIEVISLNHAPAPTAGSITTYQNTGTTQIVVNDSDLGQIHTFTIQTQPLNGSVIVDTNGLVSYQSQLNFTGSDSFVIRVTDNGLPALYGDVTINATVFQNNNPVLTAESLYLASGTTGTVQVSVQDDPGQGGTFSVMPSESGSVSISSSGLLSFTPNSGFYGGAFINVSYNDNAIPPAGGDLALPVFVNGAPSASAPAITSAGETKTTQINVADPNTSQTFTYSVQSAPAHGTASVTTGGLVSYSPALGYVGSDSITIRVADSGTPQLSDDVTIPVTVQQNFAPEATAPPIVIGVAGTGTSQIAVSDQNQGQSFVFSIANPPQHGTVSISTTGLVTYTGNAGYEGSDSVTIAVADNGNPPLSDSVIIPVSAVANFAPVFGTPTFGILSKGLPYSVVLLTDSPVTDSDGSIASISWNFGDGTSEKTSNPAGAIVHNYIAQGTYNAVITVTDNLGTSSSKNLEVVVTDTDIPTAKFTFDNVVGTAPFTINLDASGSSDADGIVAYSWNWGNSPFLNADEVTTSPTISHTFTQPGKYEVRLLTLDQHKAVGQSLLYVYVDVPPELPFYPAIPDFGVFPARRVFTGETFTFDGTRSFNPAVGASVVDYQFNFGDYAQCGDGCFVSGPSAYQYYTYPGVGTYFPSLRVSGPDGIKAFQANQEVYVVNSGFAPRAVPLADVMQGPAPLTVNFSSESYDYDGTIAGQLWSCGPDCTSNQPSFSHTFTEPNLYFIIFEAFDNDGNSHLNSLMIDVTASNTNTKKKAKRLQHASMDPVRDHKKQVLTNMCAKGKGDSCFYLSEIYREEGNTSVADKLKARACNLGHAEACASLTKVRFGR